MWKCKSCETTNVDNAKVCLVCGASRDDVPLEAQHDSQIGTRTEPQAFDDTEATTEGGCNSPKTGDNKSGSFMHNGHEACIDSHPIPKKRAWIWSICAAAILVAVFVIVGLNGSTKNSVVVQAPSSHPVELTLTPAATITPYIETSLGICFQNANGKWLGYKEDKLLLVDDPCYWQFTDCGEYYYIWIETTAGKLYIDLDNANAEKGNKVKLFEFNPAYDAQKWILTNDESGNIQIATYINAQYVINALESESIVVSPASMNARQSYWKVAEVTTKQHDPASDIVDPSAYGMYEISSDYTLYYNVDEAELVFQSSNELHPLEMTLGIPLAGSALVQMIDYNERTIATEQICLSNEFISFSNISDGIYYFYVQCGGYEPYISAPMEFIHTANGYNGDDYRFASLIRIGTIVGNPFTIKVVDQAGQSLPNREFNFGVPDANGNINSYVRVTTNEDGYLTIWGSINEIEYYDVLEFILYNEGTIMIYDDQTSIIIQSPQSGNEVVVTIE